MKRKLALSITVLLSVVLVNPVAAQETKFMGSSQVITTASELDSITAKAKKGDAAAQFDLGTIYRQGDGVPKDAANAVKWFQKAAEQGYAAAAFELGMMYRQGEGIPKNDAIAAKWYLKAAAQGDGNAQADLGVMYANGNGVSKDVVRGYAWSSLAARQGNQMAQKNRDQIEQQLTKKQLAKGQRLVSKWKKGNTLN